MKQERKLNEWIYEPENLFNAYEKASRGKRGRNEVAAFEYRLADNLLELREELRDKTYRPGDYRSFYIHEPKRRLISAAPFRDRVVHHALCNVITPIIEKQFVYDSYANRIGKGTHAALDRCQAFAQKFKYVLPCDVEQFFPAVDHVILRETLTQMVNAPDCFWLIDRILQSGQDVLSEEYKMRYFAGDDLFARERKRGLPIGNLTSQWWGNAYMNPIDQYIKRGLGCAGYIRYVDDFLLFGNDIKQLWDWRDAVIERCMKYRLTLHEASATPRPVTQGIPFLGFIVFPQQRRLKQRKGLAFRRKLKGLLKTFTSKQIEPVVRGWINHAANGDTWGLRRAVLGECNILAGGAA